ncbi:sugar ABC transporter substrate-binding protein [Ruminococcaceae bacterium OttesenSCG-928-A11]|nr:sugar ABC transporter substrate-binding protein [Ruminococcaceae bacterium OttesenSCG-928-A11]
MKKFVCILLSALLAALCLAACGGGDTPATSAAQDGGSAPAAGGADNDAPATGDQVVLTWQSWDPVEKYQPVIDAYEAQNPNVKIEYQQVADYLTKIFTEASAGELPDLIACQVGYTQSFADAGILEELDVAELQGLPDYNYADFWETTLDYAMYQGKLYGLPVDGGNYAYVYNKKIFDEYDITVPEDGFTWEEFVEVAVQLTDEASGRWGTMMNDLGLKTYLPAIWQNGGQYLNETDDKCMLGEAAAVEAVQWVKDLYATHKVMPALEKLNEGTVPIVGMLNSGTIAMGRVALWETLKLEDSDVLDWQVMHSPKGKGGHGEVLYVNTLSISASSQQKELAKEFLLFVTSEEGQRLLLENTSDPQIASRKALTQVAIAPLPEGKNAEVFMDALEYCTWMPNVLTVNEQLEAVTQELDRIWYDGEDVATVLADAAAKVDGLL